MKKMPNVYWIACAAQCVDVMLDDINKDDELHDVIITSTINNHFNL